MHDLPRVHLPAANLPKSPNLSTSPLSTNSVVPLYDASWPGLHRLDQPPASARQLFHQPDGALRPVSLHLPPVNECCTVSKAWLPCTMVQSVVKDISSVPGEQLLLQGCLRLLEVGKACTGIMGW